MFRKILYPTDFSDVSKIAINYLRQLKDAGTEEKDQEYLMLKVVTSFIKEPKSDCFHVQQTRKIPF